MSHNEWKCPTPCQKSFFFAVFIFYKVTTNEALCLVLWRRSHYLAKRKTLGELYARFRMYFINGILSFWNAIAKTQFPNENIIEHRKVVCFFTFKLIFQLFLSSFVRAGSNHVIAIFTYHAVVLKLWNNSNGFVLPLV